MAILALIASMAPAAGAQEPDPIDAAVEAATATGALPSVPGQPSLPDAPGLGQTGGAQDAVGAARNITEQAFPGAVKEQQTSAPAGGNEQSTAPECAPNMFIGVPGTFEINRDDDPNSPIGLLGKFMTPIRDQLGADLSETYINYDGDAGVNGTSYQRSVDGGVRKTLATIEDIAERCKDAQIFIAGFSQGSEIAGDTAMQIGQKQTQIDPGRVGGVVLFSDPKRDQNANLIVGTRDQQPTMPDILNGLVEEAMKDPSLAQLRSNAKPLADLANNANTALQDFVVGPKQSESPAAAEAGAETTTESKAAGEEQAGADPSEAGAAGADDSDSPAGADSTTTSKSTPSNGGTGNSNHSGGGLGAAPAAAKSDGGVHDALLHGGGAATVQHADYRPQSGPTIKLAQHDTGDDTAAESSPAQEPSTEPSTADGSDTEATDSEDDAVQKYVSGACGNQSVADCLEGGAGTDSADGDEETTTENPYAADLEAALEDADGDSQTDKLRALCGDRLSAEVCGGSQVPADASTDAGERPEDATGVVVVPKDIAEPCPEGAEDGTCYGGVEVIADGGEDAFPSDESATAYWATPALEARTRILQSSYLSLKSQAVTRSDAANNDGEGAAIRLPAGVTTIINPADGTSRDLKVDEEQDPPQVAEGPADEGDEAPVTADVIGGLFDEGWVLGRSESEESAVPAVIEQLYRGGACGDKTLDECTLAFAPDSGEPEAGMTLGQMNARAIAAASEGDEQQLPDDFAEKCLTKTVEDCAGEQVSQDVPSLPEIATSEPAGAETADADDSEAPAGDESEVADAPSEEDESPAPTTSELVDPSVSESAPSSESEDEYSESTSATENAAAGEAGAESSSTAAEAGADESTSSSAPTTTPMAAPETSGSNAAGGGLGGDAAGGEATSSSAAAAGEGSGETSADSAAGGEASESSAPATGENEAVGASESKEGEPVPVDKLTLGGVSGGGLSGKREADFGELTGRVLSPCVPGDIVCSLPEDSQLARSLVDLGKNVAMDMNDATSAEGATRMGGMLAVQAVDTVLEVTGLPRTKLSPETIEALIKIVAGVGLIAAGNQPAGAAMIAAVLPQLPTVLPEVAAQLQDLPKILEGLPQAPERAAENLGLVNNELGRGFSAGGLENPGDLAKLPQMLPGLLNTLAEDNSGLLEIAQNPAYYNSGEHHGAFDTLKVSGETNAFDWSANWFVTLGREKSAA